MRSFHRNRVRPGVSDGGQFAGAPRAEADGVTLTSRASTAAACVRHLEQREGWTSTMPLPSADSHASAAVTPGPGAVLQVHRSSVEESVILVELDPERPDPWARAAFYELHGEELSRVVSCPDGRRYRTFIASGITGPARLADELDAYLRRA